MIRSDSIHQVPEIIQEEFPALLPKQPYLAAVRTISEEVGGVEALFDHNGRIRTLTALSDNGLFSEQFAGDPELYAQHFIESEEIVKALGLRHTELDCTGVTEIPGLGKRVEYRQVLSVDGEANPVRGGYVHVFIDTEGHIFQVNSTVRFGRRPVVSTRLVTADEAIASAKSNVGAASYVSERVEFVYSSHNDRMDPCYEVTLVTENPRRVALVLVKATNGQVVHQVNKLHTHEHKRIRLEQARSKGKGKRQKRSDALVNAQPGKPVAGRSFLCIPDPKGKISDQVHDVVIDSLPDPTVLKNENCIVYLGSSQKEVRCMADGTFKYSAKDPEFAAVTTFFAFQAQMELFKSWGMVAPEKPIPIYVNDSTVRDNAYFDPEGYEIHIGIGSGSPFGLTRDIAFDLGVTWHENGHHVVFLQTPGKDLPGSEGGAIHESIGDVLGDLLMDFWFRLKYGKQLGKDLTQKDIEDDTRIIGKYAMPPNGIRIQKNTARTPEDKTGEVHDDGLISGGAKADLLVAMATQPGVDIEAALTDFGKMTLAALSLVPAHKVTFQDLLKAYLTADGKLFNGANKKLITKAFGDHGISLKATRAGAPLLIERLS